MIRYIVVGFALSCLVLVLTSSLRSQHYIVFFGKANNLELVSSDLRSDQQTIGPFKTRMVKGKKASVYRVFYSDRNNKPQMFWFRIEPVSKQVDIFYVRDIKKKKYVRIE